MKEPDWTALPRLGPARGASRCCGAVCRRTASSARATSATCAWRSRARSRPRCRRPPVRYRRFARRHAREYVAWGLATVATLARDRRLRCCTCARRVRRTRSCASRVAPPAASSAPSVPGLPWRRTARRSRLWPGARTACHDIFVRRLDAAEAQAWPARTARERSLLGPRWPVAGLRQGGRALSRRARRERPASALQRAWRFVCGRDLERPRRDRLCAQREWTACRCPTRAARRRR